MRVLTAEGQAILLASLARGETVRAACRRANLAAERFYELLREDGNFALLTSQARHDGRLRRADELAKVLYQGAAKAGRNASYTGQLIFALTNLDPAHWRNTQHVRANVEERIEHDLSDNLADILADIAGGANGGGPAVSPAEQPRSLGGGPLTHQPGGGT